MCAHLRSDDNNLILESVTFFRKLLAADRCSPVWIVIQYDLIPILLTLFFTTNIHIQHEIGWVFANVACGDIQQIKYLCYANSIPTLAYPNTYNVLYMIYRVLYEYIPIQNPNPNMDLLVEHMLWLIGKYI